MPRCRTRRTSTSRRNRPSRIWSRSRSARTASSRLPTPNPDEPAARSGHGPRHRRHRRLLQPTPATPPPPPPYSSRRRALDAGVRVDGYVLGGLEQRDERPRVRAERDVHPRSGTAYLLGVLDRRRCAPLMSPMAPIATRRTWYDATQIRGHLALLGALHRHAASVRRGLGHHRASTRRSRSTTDAALQTVDITTAFDQGAWTASRSTSRRAAPSRSRSTRTAGPNAVLVGDLPRRAWCRRRCRHRPAQSIGQYCAPSQRRRRAAYQTAIDNLRKANTGWASADGSIPVVAAGRSHALPLRRHVRRLVNGSGTMSSSKYLVENSAVIQTGSCFNPLLRGSSSSRTAWIAPPASGQAYWPSSAVVDAVGQPPGVPHARALQRRTSCTG